MAPSILDPQKPQNCRRVKNSETEKSIENKFVYNFDVNIRSSGLGANSSLIMMQWHGTPTGQLLRDWKDRVKKKH